MRTHWIWAILYLLCIPVFACIYGSFPHAFYEDKIKLERAFGADSRKVINELCQDMEVHDRSGVSQPWTEPQKFGAATYSFSRQITCFAPLKITDAGIEIRFHVENSLDRAFAAAKEMARQLSRPDPPSVRTPSRFTITLQADPASALQTDMLGSDEQSEPPFARCRDTARSDLYALKPRPESYCVRAAVSIDSTSFDSEDALLKIADLVTHEVLANLRPMQPMAGTVIELSPKTVDDLRKFLIGSSGYTSDLSDNFLRMLYLSATTITTLGLGDIVPITGTARLLVASEAVLGIILIGLFLNSLPSLRSN